MIRLGERIHRRTRHRMRRRRSDPNQRLIRQPKLTKPIKTLLAPTKSNATHPATMLEQLLTVYIIHPRHAQKIPLEISHAVPELGVFESHGLDQHDGLRRLRLRMTPSAVGRRGRELGLERGDLSSKTIHMRLGLGFQRVLQRNLLFSQLRSLYQHLVTWRTDGMTCLLKFTRQDVCDAFLLCFVRVDEFLVVPFPSWQVGLEDGVGWETPCRRLGRHQDTKGLVAGAFGNPK